MQIFVYLLRVIFLLSTIVIVTDCCSSRILLLRENTYKIIEETHNFHSHQIHEETQLENIPKTFFKDIIDQLQKYLAEVATMQSQLEAEATTTVAPNFDDTGQIGLSRTVPSLSAIEVKDESSSATVNKSAPFEIHPCAGMYATHFCLNGGRCFRVSFPDHFMKYCECPDYYYGERCESKDGKKVVPSQASRQMMNVRAARIVLTFPMLMLLSISYLIIVVIYVFRCPKHQQEQREKFRAAGMLAS